MAAACAAQTQCCRPARPYDRDEEVLDGRESSGAHAPKEQLFQAALTLLLERAGGSLTFTEAEYQAVVEKYGGSRMMAIHYEVLATPGQAPNEVRFKLVRKPPANAELTS